jgi:hypothetical protein
MCDRTVFAAAGGDAPLDGVIRRFGETRAAPICAATVRRCRQTIRRKRRLALRSSGMLLRTGCPSILEFPMNRFRLVVSSMMLACSMSVLAQPEVEPAAPPAVAAAVEATQFDFLIGQWNVEVHPKINSLAAMIHGTPRLVGIWKAQRAADGLGIEDELRVVDGSGNPLSSNRVRRTYDKVQARWTISETDAQRGRSSAATGQFIGGEMHLEGHYTDPEGKLTLTRTRYFNITADSFRMQQDRSTDNGQSWDEAALTIDARRVTAAAGS